MSGPAPLAPAPPSSSPSSPSSPRARPIGARARRSLRWQLAGRGSEQCIRLGANLVLARLLAPEDFGLMGMAASGLAFAEAASHVGTEQAVIADRRGRRPRYIATAYAMSLLRGLLLAAALLWLAGPLSRWYGQPDAVGIFLLIAVQPLLLALGHPGAQVPLRGLRFGRWTGARTLAVAAGTAGTIVLAIATRSVWALVVGQLMTTALVSIGSHIVTPRTSWVRPRIHRRHVGSIVRFSAGAVGTPLLIMLIIQAPPMIVGPVLGPAILGVYLLHRRLAEIAPQLAISAAGSVLVPVYAALRDDPARAARTWRRTVQIAGLLASISVAGLAWLGGDLPAVVLGEPYRGSPGLLGLLALAGGLAAVLGVVGPLFWGVGRPQLDRRVQCIRTAVTFLAGLPLLMQFGPSGFAAATAAAAGLALLYGLHLAAPIVDVSVGGSLRALGPGIAAGVCLASVGVAIDLMLHPAPIVRVVIAGTVAGTGAAIWMARYLRTDADRPPTPMIKPVT
ncbi:MAG: oligosaccharide flippase family protein [Phycisphaerales bacterium]